MTDTTKPLPNGMYIFAYHDPDAGKWRKVFNGKVTRVASSKGGLHYELKARIEALERELEALKCLR